MKTKGTTGQTKAIWHSWMKTLTYHECVRCGTVKKIIMVDKKQTTVYEKNGVQYPQSPPCKQWDSEGNLIT